MTNSIHEQMLLQNVLTDVHILEKKVEIIQGDLTKFKIWGAIIFFLTEIVLGSFVYYLFEHFFNGVSL